MPTYQEYLKYAEAKGFKPASEVAFNSILKTGYNPVTKTFL